MQSFNFASIRRRLVVAAPFALTSMVLIALTMRAWSHCNGSPCLAFLVLVPLLMVLAGLGIGSGWLATSPNRWLRWSARVIGACAMLVEFLLIAMMVTSPM